MKLMVLLLTMVVAVLGSPAQAETQFIKYKNYLIPINVEVCEKPQVIVATDYNGVDGDPNEIQDLVHFLVYSYLFDVKGIVATAKPAGGRASKIIADLREYDRDLPLLRNYLVREGLDEEFSYPTYEYLKSRTFQGGTSVSAPGVQLIVDEANLASQNCPLNVLVWGASTDIAAALNAMPSSDRRKVNVIAIGSTNRAEVEVGRCRSTKGDQAAWNTVNGFSSQLAGWVPLDGPRCGSGSGNDTFRTLFSPSRGFGGFGVSDSNRQHSCNTSRGRPGGVNLYPGKGAETYMNQLDDGKTTGLRGLLKSSRNKTTLLNCNNDANGKYSPRFADFVTTLFLLSDEIQVEGEPLDVQISTDPGASFSANRSAVFEDFLNKMNSIYGQ